MEINVTLHADMPCKGCGSDCEDNLCQLWRSWFLGSWEAVNRFAWQEMDRQGKEQPKCFTYELPHMVKSPCTGCVCESWCDTPCSRRLQWWDDRMEGIRRRMGHGIDT